MEMEAPFDGLLLLAVVVNYCKSCFKIEITAILKSSPSTATIIYALIDPEVQPKMNRKLTPQS